MSNQFQIPLEPAGEKPIEEPQARPEEAIRLASHELIPVGETRNFGNIGQILEVMQFGKEKISVDADSQTVTCIDSGVACIRAKY